MQTNTPLDKKALFICLSVLVFLGAFLLFAVEPLTGKIITPSLGGTSTVWIICLLFFQLVVLGGYLLTYVLSRFPRRMQVVTYILLFALSLLWAHVPNVWSFDYKTDPTWVLLAALTVHLGPPCIVLSSISGTMQVWQAATGSINPYKLYSLSNLGSFAALLMYPTLIEPQFTVTTTLWIWQAIYFALFALALPSAFFVWRHFGSSASMQAWASAGESGQIEEGGPGKKEIALWLFLSTLGSAGLVAFSNYITTDVAPVPLLWVLPLAIYLVSFVIAFARSNMKTDLIVQFWIPTVIAEPVSMCISPAVVLLVNLILLFQLCLVTSAELAASKPAPRFLPSFYLALAVGGALGGVLVALVAPLCFNFAGERSVVILIFTVYQLFSGQDFSKKRQLTVKIVLSILMTLVLGFWLIAGTPDIVHRERNFFGSVSIKHEDDMLSLYHGRVKHGQQFLDPAKGGVDVYLYGPPAALVFAFLHATHNAPLDVGVIGLGTGSMAIEAQKGDQITFYEMDPKVESIAQRWFTYLKHSLADVSIQIGDGRLLVQNSQHVFDGLCIDAFSGDAVPVHLLTVEAMKAYLQHLKPNGLLFFHITNAFLDIAPVIGNVAKELHLEGCELVMKEVRYVVLTQDPATMRAFVAFAQEQGKNFSNSNWVKKDPTPTTVTTLPTRPDLKVWTDDYSNLFSVLKWRNE